jgi:hypothetical protein
MVFEMSESIPKEKVFTFIEEMIDALTFRRIALITILTTLTIILVSIFENRTALFALMYKSTISEKTISWVVSKETQDDLRSIVDRYPLVSMAILSEVNLKKNRRTVKHIYSEDKSVSLESKLLPLRTFSSALFDYDAKNTEQMISMLSNDFSCVQTSETTAQRITPELTKDFPVTCRLAIPPFFGELIGYVSLMLQREPTQDEKDSLRIEMNRFAIETYLRDVSKVQQLTK